MAELRKRGLATAVIVSTAFQKLGEAQVRTLGVPGLPLIVIPHPLGGLAIDDVKGRADIALPQLVRFLEEQAA